MEDTRPNKFVKVWRILYQIMKDQNRLFYHDDPWLNDVGDVVKMQTTRIRWSYFFLLG